LNLEALKRESETQKGELSIVRSKMEKLDAENKDLKTRIVYLKSQLEPSRQLQTSISKLQNQIWRKSSRSLKVTQEQESRLMFKEQELMALKISASRKRPVIEEPQCVLRGSSQPTNSFQAKSSLRGYPNTSSFNEPARARTQSRNTLQLQPVSKSVAIDTCDLGGEKISARVGKMQIKPLDVSTKV
jgi:cell division septum initiation protein DivIVA